MLRRLAVLAVAIAPAIAAADDGKRCIDAEFTPADGLQIVVWLEDTGGNYIDTLFITQQTGTYGLGNRPGRFDFNSGPMWPYGRRITTFPVWSHINGQSFPSVLYQDRGEDDADIQDPSYCQNLPVSAPNYVSCGENDLSHSQGDSSHENHFCRPVSPTQDMAAWDAMTCPSPTNAFTDKGRLSTDPQYNTGYPPRTDFTPDIGYMLPDSPDTAMYATMNPFDAVSQPTPIGGVVAHTPWAVPDSLPDGSYVIYIEASKENDFNTNYSYPSPAGIAWSGYGAAYRGQPSVIYTVPITISAMAMTSSTMTIAGYGDPDGVDGAIRPPDSTITSDTPGSGLGRLQLVSDGTNMYRVQVTNLPDDGSQLPAAPDQLQSTTITSSDATVTFVAPGTGADDAIVTGYDIRVLANAEMTADNFASATPITTKVVPVTPGHTQTVDVGGLLPDTDYWIGVRAYNGCDDDGPLAIVHVTTADRQSGAVDACFIATAAYGSIMANDVVALRAFRDRWLETNVIGELGVEAYYTFGPAIAGVIGESDLLRTTARAALAPLVRAVRR